MRISTRYDRHACAACVLVDQNSIETDATKEYVREHGKRTRRWPGWLKLTWQQWQERP